MKRWIHASTKKNNSGGEIIDEISFGNITVTYETYYHSGTKQRIIIKAGSKVIGSAFCLDNQEAVDACLNEMRDFVESFDTSGGEAGYYKYQNAWSKVKEGLVDILNDYKPMMTLHKYDPVSGELLDQIGKVKL